MRLKDLSDRTSDLFNIPVDRLTIDPDFNVRFDTPEVAEHIESLRDSILAQGYLRSRPLTIRLSDDGTAAVVTDGHCRFAAVKMAIAAGAEILTLPCLPEGKGVTVADRTLMLLTANNGLPLSPMEQAEAVKRLLSYGWSESEIGRKIGRTRQHIANLLELAGAPDGVRVMVVNGTVSATEAVKTIRRDGAAAVETLNNALVTAVAAGKRRVTPKFIAPTPPVEPIDDTPRMLQKVRMPLSFTAAHVVEMAKGVDLPEDLRRAIDALAESLS